MLESGVDIQHALIVIARRCRSRSLSEALLVCEKEIGAGANLADSLGRQKQFPSLVPAMVRAGEKTGRLSEVFGELGGFFEFKAQLWRRFINKITLPVLQYCVAVFVLSLAGYIVGTIQDRPVSMILPLMAGYGIPAAAILSLVILTRLSGGSRLVHGLLWHFPLISRTVRPAAVARFSLCFKFSLETGMHVKEALHTAFEASGNEAFRARARIAVAHVTDGGRLTAALEKTGLFEDEYIDVAAIGEESGKMAERMHWLSAHYREKSENALNFFAIACAVLIWAAVAGVLIFFIFTLYLEYISHIGGVAGIASIL